MRRPKKDIQLTSYDELLGLEETPEKSMNQVVEIDLANCTKLITKLPATDANGESSVQIIKTQDTVYLKMWVAVWIVSHTFTITMAVFDVGQSVVSRAAGVISSDTAINIDTMISTMETAMESMEIGELVILALETMLVSLCMKIISVFITVILYGRMIEIYLYSSVGAIPFATMSNREWGQIGNNYLRGLFALAFQGFFMMVCVGIYAVLVANIQMSDNIHSALFGVMAYTVILCFSLMKTGNFARSIFNAH